MMLHISANVIVIDWLLVVFVKQNMCAVYFFVHFCLYNIELWYKNLRKCKAYQQRCMVGRHSTGEELFGISQAMSEFSYRS